MKGFPLVVIHVLVGFILVLTLVAIIIIWFIALVGVVIFLTTPVLSFVGLLLSWDVSWKLLSIGFETFLGWLILSIV